MDRQTLILNIIKRCEEIGEPPTAACTAAGVGKDFIGNLRKGQWPSVAKVADLAAYLGVTTSDLVGDARPAEGAKKEPADRVGELERSFEFLIKDLSPEARRELAQTMIGKLIQ